MINSSNFKVKDDIFGSIIFNNKNEYNNKIFKNYNQENNNLELENFQNIEEKFENSPELPKQYYLTSDNFSDKFTNNNKNMNQKYIYILIILVIIILFLIKIYI